MASLFPRSLFAALIGLFAVSATTFLPPAGYSFDDFNAEFQRGYEPGTQQYTLRRNLFEEKVRSILAHNADPTMSWKRGINQFADMTQEEFRQSGRLGYDRRLARHLGSKQGLSGNIRPSAWKGDNDPAMPPSVDWRNKGVISNVKDQGQCGSCWAFATTAVIESHVALATGTLEVLSPQQLVSCALNPLECGGTGGCGGSIPEVAFEYVQLYGMTTEWMLPYTSYFGKSDACSLHSTQTPAVIEISGYQKLPPNDYHAVMEALVNVGPLAVNVQADVWSDYHSGVFEGCSNRSDVSIDHVVQLVGYGTDCKDGDYWLVRNSWDATWGEKGYIRLRRSSKPDCGEDTEPTQGTGCAGGPATQQVCGQCGILFDVSYPLGAKLRAKSGSVHSDEIQV
eukprot:CAMPEP_0115123794 /NCGR_PEP_ID=MMETSP0227-20121206/47796_1 /TAXON_ID=89957 /ORGANISM="Polarella glacialis, Strain CCMP 1383" /LENGTH=395 /DNA_ID=CAMNT_0002526317 /DNA_START=35 /DNA_END=1222 /DNA_ORIENTATION=+